MTARPDKAASFWPRRVVSLQPSVTTTLAALGLLDRLVACTKYCVEACPEASGRQIVSDSWSAQAAEIASCTPDLVVASVPYQIEAIAEILKTGTRVLTYAPSNLADIYTDTMTLAGVMGEPERGEELVARMRDEIDAIRWRVAAVERRPRVFCEEWGKPIIASQRWVAELVEAAGGDFVAEPGKQTTADAVRASAPDVVIAAWCGAGDRVPLEKIVRDRDWLNIPAMRERRVFCIPDEFLNTPGPPLIDGLHALAGCLHPDLLPAHPRVRQIGTV